MPEFVGIVEESLKCSIFGIFGKNFSTFQQQQIKGPKYDKVFNVFGNSDILAEENQLLAALLYFNLPYESIIKDVKMPNKIASYPISRQGDTDGNNINDLIEKFEHVKSKSTPSVILIKIEKRENHDGDERSYIIGGYASHGWLVSGGSKQNSASGDRSCFLFNLTQNLRFNAREGFNNY